ncbi:MAG: hypothetical protein H7066_07750 [Cytophagaceae bacterium]|nr:hypothetical protein [Gemmatimonadaceae bacterium]
MSNRDLADPEVIQAGDSPSGAFVVVALQRAGAGARFRFAISAVGRDLVQRILGTRPFGEMPDVPHRYFYAGRGGHGSPITHVLYVRIERGRDQRTNEFESPADLVDALEWFRQLPSLAAAAHLQTST